MEGTTQVNASIATITDETTYTAATVTPFPQRPANAGPAAPTSAALEEYLAEQNMLAATVHELRAHGLDALDGWMLDEPTADFAVALLDGHSA